MKVLHTISSSSRAEGTTANTIHTHAACCPLPPPIGISSMIATWLDEEWTPLEVHTELGKAAGAAYVACRQEGDDDMSSLVLGLSNELLAFNYRETFVNAFEVGGQAAACSRQAGNAGPAHRALPEQQTHAGRQSAATPTHTRRRSSPADLLSPATDCCACLLPAAGRQQGC